VPGAGGCEGSGRVDGVVVFVDVLVVVVLKDELVAATGCRGCDSDDMVLVEKKGYWIGGIARRTASHRGYIS
jgi:hypothetical protein